MKQLTRFLLIALLLVTVTGLPTLSQDGEIGGNPYAGGVEST
jgi:hypothetical protein